MGATVRRPVSGDGKGWGELRTTRVVDVLELEASGLGILGPPCCSMGSGTEVEQTVHHSGAIS